MERPFDLYGDLEDAYDEAELNGDVEVMETLDVFDLWSERPRGGNAFLHTLLRAIHGDVEAQDAMGHVFFWSEDDPNDSREKCEWLYKPNLAQYWYGLAAKAGCANSQNYLGGLYCPNIAPLDVFKLGRMARSWWEEAAGQKRIAAMRNLANCLRCGKCCCCDTDLQRAEALEAEAYRLEEEEREEKVKGR